MFRRNPSRKIPVTTSKPQAAKNREQKRDKINLSKSDSKDDFNNVRKTTRELLAPMGADNSNPEFFVLYDAARKFYVLTMYLHKLPQRTTFADFYRHVSSFQGVLTNFYINPISATKMHSMVDKRVTSTSIALSEAQQKGSRLDVINASKKLNESDSFADYIMSGDNALFEVQVFYTLMHENREDLVQLANVFVSEVRQLGADVVSCFCMQEEAFRSVLPLNRVVYKHALNHIAKRHILDKAALGDIFCHTSNKFFHKNGVYVGYYLDDASDFFWDIFDKSHNAYNFIVAGTTGTGKSLMVKVIFARYAAFGMRFRILDVEAKNNCGEYTALCRACGGVVFTLKSVGSNNDSYNILNPFELIEQEEYDEETNTTYMTVSLNEKITYMQSLIMSMVTSQGSMPDTELAAALVRIITDACRSLYDDLGIEEGKPQSLFSTRGSAGLLNSGKNRKPMPTFSDLYIKLLHMQRGNTVFSHKNAYVTLLDVLATYVRGVYYSEETLKTYTEEEYNAFPQNPVSGLRERRELSGATETIIAVRGTRSYFDGQSTCRVNHDTPFVDYDISQLPKDEIPFAMLACLGYIEQFDIRRNSANPHSAKPLCFFMDELHKTFTVQGAATIIDGIYRTGRKRLVSCGVATQSIADFGRSPILTGIYENSPTVFLLRHKKSAGDFLRTKTDLNPAQIERLYTLGYMTDDGEMTEAQKSQLYGQVCVQDAGRIAFIKVDYIKEVESFFAETNQFELQKMTAI